MNEQELLSIILQNTYTKADYLRRLSLLREYFEEKFFSINNQTMTDFLTSQNSSEEDLAAMSSWNPSFYNSFSRNNLYHLLDSLTKYIKEIPIITLYIPIDTSDSDKYALGKWFRTSVATDILLDIRIDEKKVGGLAFIKSSRFFDYSLPYFISKNRNNILKMIDNFAYASKRS